MTYSKTHQRFSDELEKTETLTDPKKYLGPNYLKVLEFWKFIDTLSVQEKNELTSRYWNLDSNVRISTRNAAINAAEDVVGEDFSGAAWWAAYNVTKREVFGEATEELIGDVDNKVAYDLIMFHKNPEMKMVKDFYTFYTMPIYKRLFYALGIGLAPDKYFDKSVKYLQNKHN